MFKKLRNKFLFMMVGTTSLIFIVMAFFIYGMTYKSTQAEIEKRFTGILFLSTGPENNQSINLNDDTIYIAIDSHGNIKQEDSTIPLEDMNIYKEVIPTIMANKDSKKILTIKNSKWRYTVSNLENQSNERIDNNSELLIQLLNVSDFYSTLFNLKISIIIIGIVSLFIILITSFWFSNKSVKPLELAWEKQKHFVSNVSHELKTPISIINANYDVLIENREQTIDSQIKWLNYIKIGTQRMSDLIDKLLTLERLEDIHLNEIREAVPVTHLINEEISSMESFLQKKHITLESNIDSGIIIYNNPDFFKQIINILLINSIQHNHCEGTIFISLIKEKQNIIFSITNTGSGIPKKDLPYVFDRFFQVDSSRKHNKGHYGLGLSIAKTLAHKMSGELTVDSELNNWTTFTLSLKS